MTLHVNVAIVMTGLEEVGDVGTAVCEVGL